MLTLQTYKWWISTQACQIMLIEYLLHLDVEVCFKILILQLHLDVVLELIEFGEYRYHRHLKSPPCQP